jgi:O-acetylserine/cysteine efflux transporter
MKPKHILLALLIAAVWGFNFTVIRIGLDAFPPLLLATLRFVLAAMPVFFLPRPKLSWPRMLALGLAWFVGQFAFLFTGMAWGMPPGLASVVLQSQAFFTVTISALFLRELPRWKQTVGTCVALLGLTIIGTTAGTGGMNVLGLSLTLGAAVCWAAGNVLMRGAGKVDMLPLIVWLSIIPPLPMLALSYGLEGGERIAQAITHVGWIGIGSLAYLVLLATLFGFTAWGHLLKVYPAPTVAPFSLLVPVFGTTSSFLVLGESFGLKRLAGMALILAGLAVVVLPPLGLFRAKTELVVPKSGAKP